LSWRAQAVPYLFTLLLTACGGGGGGASAPVAPGPNGNPAPGVTAEYTLDNVEVAPYAIWADAVASQSITVKAHTKTVGNIRLTLSYFDGLVGGAGARVVRSMFDDGTHGDEVAADGIWSLTFVFALNEPSQLRLYDGQIDAVSIAIEASDGKGFVAPTNAIDARVDVALVSASLRDQVVAQQIDATTLLTDALVNIVDPSFDEAALPRITEHLYRVFPSDPFDFAVIFHTRSTGDGIPRSIGVKNDVEGINLASYDRSAAYGSAGRLQQVVFQKAHTLGLEINHELGHRWGAYLNNAALNLTLPTGFHWGPSDHVGQMGNGPYLQPEDGSYRVTNGAGSEHFISNSFSSLELYLMGLAPAGDVAPLRFVTDPTIDVRFGALVPETATREVTIDDVIDVYGAREPSAATSQNAFTAAFVVVSHRPLAAAEYTLSTVIARYAAGTSFGGQRSGGLFEVSDPSSFGASTGFTATLDTQLPVTG
jgi:hypothetical protein